MGGGDGGVIGVIGVGVVGTYLSVFIFIFDIGELSPRRGRNPK